MYIKYQDFIFSMKCCVSLYTYYFELKEKSVKYSLTIQMTYGKDYIKKSSYLTNKCNQSQGIVINC